MKKMILILAGSLFVCTAHANVPQSKLLNIGKNDFVLTFELNTFCKAIVNGDVKTVKRMIDLGEDVNRKSLGMAPVHFAARYNKTEILKILIANGADLKKRSDKGYTAKKYAELSNATEVLIIIKKAMKK